MPEAPDITHARWRKSSRSGGQGNCVEVANLDQVFGVRDSKDMAGPVLLVPARSWGSFVEAVKRDRFGPSVA